MALSDERLVKISRYLAKHLRHRPERLDLRMDGGGWVDIDELLNSCTRSRFPISRAELEEVVVRNDKRRYALDPTGTRIRATQGHSRPIELGLEPLKPPPVLHHGTYADAVGTVMVEGLSAMGRTHVHLSADPETAQRVGSRRGPPVVLRIDAAAMHTAGHRFWCSDNGVWLVEGVPPRFLRRTVPLHDGHLPWRSNRDTDA